jgi:hypothetical protein
MHMRAEVATLLSAPDPSVKEKLDDLLVWISRLSKAPGREAVFDHEHDYTMVSARDSQEAEFLVEALADNGLITSQEFMGNAGYACRLTVAGWASIQKLQQDGADSNIGFVSMAFESSQDEARQAIMSAISDAGYRPLRMDEHEHPNRIDDEIIAQLRRSKFLIGDLTLQNKGVYFEAGFMLGLGRTVVMVCQKEDLDNVHFDIRQYNTIDYDGPGDLKKRLQSRIEAILGKGKS